MPFCPKCRSEYRPEISICADCNEELLAELPAQVRSRWVPVYSGDSVSSQIVQASLEAAGIATQVPDEIIASPGLLSARGMMFVQVFVPESEAEQAREILKGHDKLGTDSPDQA